MLDRMPSGTSQKTKFNDSGSLDEEWLDLRSLINLVWRQRRIIAGVFALFNLIAIIALFQIDQRYTATALVVIDPTESRLVGIDQDTQSFQRVDGVIETAVEIAKSNNVALRVLSSINLGEFEEFQLGGSLMWQARQLFSFGEDTVDEPIDQTRFSLLRESQKRLLVDAFQSIMSVDRRRSTSVIGFSATTKAPTNAARLANLAANAYLDEQIEAKLGITQRAVVFLRGRVEELGDAIQSGESDIDEFVINWTANLGSLTVREQIAELRENLANEKQNRADREAALESIRRIESGSEADFGEQFRRSEIARLAQERADFASRLSRSETTEETAVAFRQRIADLDRTIGDLADQERSSVASQIAESRARSEELRGQLQSVIKVQDIPREIAVELFRLQRDVSASRELYGTYLARLRQVEQQSSLSLSGSRVAAAAIVPIKPSYPPRRLGVLASILGGLALGFGVALLRDLYIGGFMTIEQLESVTGATVLSVIPQVDEAGDDQSVSPDRLISEKPLSAYSEAFRRLKIGLDVAQQTEGPRVLMVTSSDLGEGKSISALSLARSYSLAGKRTLLIDCDLRRPSLHTLMGHPAEQGLGDFLSGPRQSGIFKSIIKREKATNLDVIMSSGPSGIATDTMFSSDRFSSLMAAAREWYEVTIIDTPPIRLVVDARVIGQHCDQIIYVVRWASTSQRNVRQGLRELSSLGNKPIYVSLNQTNEDSDYGFGYRYNYYYR